MHNMLIMISLFLLAGSLCQAQPNFQLEPANIEAETRSIWRTLRDISILEQFGYSISLPQHSYIDSLAAHARAGTLPDSEYDRLLKFVRTTVFDSLAYQEATRKVQQAIPLLDSMLALAEAQNFRWDFQRFDPYTIRLTLYGSGGSYDPETGEIILFTTPDGRFRQYQNPANTLIHEVVHLGIEQSLIQRYNVPHAMKERIVDSFVKLMFGEYLPAYRIQEMGDTRIDTYLSDKQDLHNLPEAIQLALIKNP